MSTRDPLLAHPPDLENESWMASSIFDKFLLKHLKDPRDLLGARLMMRLGIAAPLAAALLFVPGVRSVWTVGAYYLLIFGMMDSYILGMHMHYHRNWFKSKKVNGIMPNFVGFFFGQTLLTYWAHHLAMHHPEDNDMTDLSTTQPFQRDSLAHLLFYQLSFVTVGIPQLIIYFFKKGRPEIGRRIIFGEVISWCILGALAMYDAGAVLFVFVVPIAVARFMMMLGNWGQHAFVYENPGPFTQGGTLLNTYHNRRCFNNGYHSMHHHRQALHWSLMPQQYEDQKEEYAKAGAPVFERVPTFQFLTLALVLQRYNWLEKRLVRFEGDTRTAEERIAWMRSMMKPVPRLAANEAVSPAGEQAATAA